MLAMCVDGDQQTVQGPSATSTRQLAMPTPTSARTLRCQHGTLCLSWQEDPYKPRLITEHHGSYYVVPGKGFRARIFLICIPGVRGSYRRRNGGKVVLKLGDQILGKCHIDRIGMSCLGQSIRFLGGHELHTIRHRSGRTETEGKTETRQQS